jgi:aspartyl/asparaginyl beta-hydroxylase (cupin superfamily)
MAHLARVVEAMRTGGFYGRIMDGGPELDRMKTFLRRCAGEEPAGLGHPQVRPKYPLFPELRNQSWRDAAQFPAARILEREFPSIRDEALRVGLDRHVDYSSAAGPWRSWSRPWTLFKNRRAEAQAWTLYLMYHMGVDVEPVAGLCPVTHALLRSLPGACLDYTWGDFVLSAMNGRTHLRPHCSIDNLRVRIHLGLTIPRGCSIRVGTETRQWQEGRCLVFEDSFEHEVWNRSGERRVVLIADLWHPDLTPVEIRALTSGFRKSAVRRVFLHERLGLTDDPGRYAPFIEEALARQDEEPVVREFWPA